MADRHAAPARGGTDEALARFDHAFPGLRVSVAPVAGRFAFDYQSLVTPLFTVNRLRCLGGLRAVGDIPESVAIGRRTSGAIAIRRDGTRVDTSQPYLRPTASSELEVRDGSGMLVALQPASVVEYMERSGDRITFSRRAINAPPLLAMNLVLDHAGRLLDDHTDLATQTMAELHDLICWTLLRAYEDPWAEATRPGSGSAALRRALRFMEEHAGKAVTMPEVAEAARISVRSLDLAFQRELGTTPFRWLRDHRLDRAREDLLAGAGSVAGIAGRHGMPSGGRFAAHYRARFQEYPADTLRRSPGSAPSAPHGHQR